MILSAGIIPVRKSAGTFQFLILRCFKYWDFPKGETDEGEDPKTAALRELAEETSLTDPDLNWGEEFYETEIYSKGKIARYYLAEVKADSKIELLPNPENGMIEHHEFRWVSFEDGLKLTNPRIQKVLLWAQRQLKGES